MLCDADEFENFWITINFVNDAHMRAFTILFIDIKHKIAECRNTMECCGQRVKCGDAVADQIHFPHRDAIVMILTTHFSILFVAYRQLPSESIAPRT